MGIIHTETNGLARRVAQYKYRLELIPFLSSSLKLVEFMSNLTKLCVLKMKLDKNGF